MYLYRNHHRNLGFLQNVCIIVKKKIVRQKKSSASAGSRTRIDCLEGNHANRYTTDALTTQIKFTMLFNRNYELVQSFNYFTTVHVL